jgi:hypothetical protein
MHYLEPDLLKTLIKGGDSDRFRIKPTKLVIIFPYYQSQQGVWDLISEKRLRADYPLTYSYFHEVKKYLEKREDGITKGARWYSYTRTQNIDVIGMPKLITPDLAERSSFSYDPTGDIFFAGGAAGGYGILPKSNYDPRYLIGILNSALINWFIQTSGTQMESGYYAYEARFIRSAPIKQIEADDASSQDLHDRIVQLVDSLLHWNARKNSRTIAPSEQNRLDREISAADAGLNQLVFRLYGCTAEEVDMVCQSATG